METITTFPTRKFSDPAELKTQTSTGQPAGPRDQAGETKAVCAWCGVFLHGNPEASQVSHGMCPACSANFRLQIADLRLGNGDPTNKGGA